MSDPDELVQVTPMLTRGQLADLDAIAKERSRPGKPVYRAELIRDAVDAWLRRQEGERTVCAVCGHEVTFAYREDDDA